MELKDLVGKHILDAVDFTTGKVSTYGDEFEDAQLCRFRLDGNIYVAIEDPSDGYRSYLGELKIDTENKMFNIFPPISVIGHHRTIGSYGNKDDILELIDETTGKIVLEIGTADIDDYYPGFIASFHPEAMQINKGD